jgi:hypothetical protein
MGPLLDPMGTEQALMAGFPLSSDKLARHCRPRIVLCLFIFYLPRSLLVMFVGVSSSTTHT